MINISLLVPLGIILLYLPPLLIFLFQKHLNRIRENLTYTNIITISFILTSIMILLLNPAAYTFIMYFILFNLFFFYTERLTLDRCKALSLSIYACFAVSVLWEWPIQITIFQNIDAVIMSGFKLLGLIFFYNALRNTRFKLTSWLGLLITSTIFLGLLIILGIYFIGIAFMFFITHLYRLPWIIILLYSITMAYKPLNKEGKMLKSGLVG